MRNRPGGVWCCTPASFRSSPGMMAGWRSPMMARRHRYSKPQVSWDIHSYVPYRGRRNLMPGSYSTDLRERVLVAVESGEPADVVAEAFMIGRSSVYRWIAVARDEGRRVAKPMGRGPEPIIRDETAATLCRLLEADNHLTLAECRDRLAEETGVRVNSWTIGRALRRLDWT